MRIRNVLSSCVVERRISFFLASQLNTSTSKVPLTTTRKYRVMTAANIYQRKDIGLTLNNNPLEQVLGWVPTNSYHCRSYSSYDDWNIPKQIKIPYAKLDMSFTKVSDIFICRTHSRHLSYKA